LGFSLKLVNGNKVEIFVVSITILGVLVLTGILSNSSSFNQEVNTEYELSTAFPDLTFSKPVGIYNAGDNRLFVVEQVGTIQIIDRTVSNDSTTLFLDVQDQVLYGGEQGLLGLAFHPDFKLNGLFYINYIADEPRRTVAWAVGFVIGAIAFQMIFENLIPTIDFKDFTSMVGVGIIAYVIISFFVKSKELKSM